MLLNRSLRIIALLGFVWVMIVGSEPEPQIHNLRIWRDVPSEALIEINAHLSRKERFAWYVDPALDVQQYPGVHVELDNGSLADALDAYCAEAGLEWHRVRRSVWIYQSVDMQEIEELQAQLYGEESAGRVAARNALLAKAAPESIAVILKALAADNPVIAGEALQGLHDFLHSSPDWGPSVATGMTLFGNPDWPRNSIQPFLRYHLDIIAPWAVLEIAAQDALVADAIEVAIENHSDTIGDHLVLAMAAVCAGRSKAAKRGLAPWFDVGGGWQQRYLSGRVSAALAYSGYDDGNAASFAELKESVDAAMNIIRDGDRRQRRNAEREAQDILSTIASLGSEVARDFLLSLALNSEHPQGVREAAVQHLQPFADSQLVEPLLDVHQAIDKHGDFSRAILDLLRHIPDQQAQQYATLAIRQSLQVMVDALTDSDDERALRNIRQWLQDIGENRGLLPVSVLTTMLQYDATPQELRREICGLLASHRHPEMIPALVHTFHNDEWPDVRRAAALALGLSRLSDGIEVLQGSVNDQASPANRRAAALGLANARHLPSFPLFVSLIEQSTSVEDRIFLIQHLGIIRHDESVNYLLGVLGDAERPLLDRQAAASGLSLVPTERARSALVDIIKGDYDLPLQRQTMDALSPRSPGEVPLFAPILLEILASRPQSELLRMVVNNLRRCMVGFPPGHPHKKRIEEAVFQLVVDREVDNNARRDGLELFQYSDSPSAVAHRLESVQGTERNPVMRSFFARAIEELRKK